MKNKYEYRRIHAKDRELEGIFTKASENRWELVSALLTGTDYHTSEYSYVLFFKRELKELEDK